MVTSEQLSETSSIDQGYWLAHSEGYRVESGEGRIGLVEEVRHAPDGHADTLAVRAGRFGLRTLIVPTSEVEVVVPRDERIVVRSPARIEGSEPLGTGAASPEVDDD